jgi:MFS family permease
MATGTTETRDTDTRVDHRTDGARPVDVQTEERRTEERRTTTDPYAGIAAARERFGGIDIPATLVGMLTALSTTLILAGLVGAAVGAVGYQTGLESDAQDISTASLIGGVAVLFVAYVIGGWAAGRIARYDGARNGFATGIWTLILAAIVSGLAAWLGSEYDVLGNVDLPQWFSSDAFTMTAIASGIAGVIAMFVGGTIGGYMGERYHRRADRTILSVPRSETVRTAERA